MTVEQAYRQLVTEGYVANVPRSGYLVAHVDTDYMALAREADGMALETERDARDRDAFLALPPALLARYWDLFNFAHPPVSWLEQEVLARFIASGHWDAHVRKTAHGNHRRHDELLRCLRAEMEGRINISGVDTGMHLYVSVKNGMSQIELLESAREQGATIYGTSRMWFSRPAPEENVMIGFSAIALEDIGPGVRALKRAWF